MVIQTIGIAVGLYYLYFMVMGGITSKVLQACIVYSQPLGHSALVAALYAFAICGACFVSSKRIVRLLGVLVVVSLAVASYFYIEALVSVWCFFAALLSIIIYLHFRLKKGMI